MDGWKWKWKWNGGGDGDGAGCRETFLYSVGDSLFLFYCKVIRELPHDLDLTATNSA
jgi:hypothetical protein